MGSGIAQKMATEGFDVVLVDLDAEKVAKGIAAIERMLQEAVGRGIMRHDRASAIRERVHGTSRLDELCDADLVVEAVFEDRALKENVLRQLETVCRPDTIFATNTSSYLVSDIATALRLPERMIGLHYFFHPAKNRLVEVIAGAKTSRSVFARAWALQEQLGKIPIASRDSSGFVVNRFFVVWLMEAIRMLQEGIANAITIDDIAKRTFGVGMGPFELMNVSGVPIALHASTTIGNAFGPLYGPPDLLRRQVDSAQLWSIGGTVDLDVEAAVSERLRAGVFLSASSLVSEGVGSKEDVDIGARVGLRWARGPFEMMNALGTSHALELTTMLAARWQMRVPPLLLEVGRVNKPVALDLVRATVENGVTTITINRPDAMNALNETVATQLQGAFTRAHHDLHTTGIVIAGAGRSFVAGADIRFFIRNIETGELARTAKFTEDLQRLLQRIEDCPKPVIARIHGVALGGGVELALACDYIVATPNAVFGFPETGIGIYPGLGGTQRTTYRIGAGLTKWLIFTGQLIGAHEALAIGLIDAVVERDDLDAAIMNLIARGPALEHRPSPPPVTYKRLADFFETNDVESIRVGRAPTAGDDQLEKAMNAVRTKAPIALRIAGSLIDDALHVPLEEGIRMELSHLTEIFATKDAMRGLQSVGKSRPVFEGA